MERPDIYKSLWQEWKRSPVTKAFIYDLMSKREELKEGLADGACSEEKEEQRIVGRAMALKDAISYAIEDFIVVDDTQEEQKEDGI